jgi:hypothetical protein
VRPLAPLVQELREALDPGGELCAIDAASGHVRDELLARFVEAAGDQIEPSENEPLRLGVGAANG